MPSVAIVGAQWGDEGKGKVVDLYTESADLVVRYSGGPNAGHTLVVGDEKLVVRLLPSGILRPDTRSLLGQGMVIDPSVLLGEIDELARRGRPGLESRVTLSTRAHLILPYHITIDGLRESSARAIGTTKKGIGPAYEDKVRRSGVRAGDLADFDRLRARVAGALEAWAPVLRAFGGEVPSVDSIVEPLEPSAKRIVPLLGDVGALVERALKDGARVVFEGAQGTLLDVDGGTYPFVTSSSAVAGGAAIGTGVGPSRIGKVIGITKAYTTRVGGGPFPTELDDADGRHLRDVGAEFGSVTGRPRRTGWLDLPALRYAVRVNGLDGLALTKLDVLTGLERVKLCVAYDAPGGRTEDFPIDLLGEPDKARPVYHSLEGWKAALGGERSLEALPPAALAYVRYLEQAVGVPLYLVSVGPRRTETIVLRHPFAD
jgi:adenylosuccinate synthase